MAQGPDVAPFFDGVISVETGDGWARPWRLQHKERSLYDRSLAAMAACSAVRILLRTTGGRLRIVASVASVPGVDAAALAKIPAYPLEYDLYVDGAFVATRQLGATEGAHTVEFEGLAAGGKDVEVWLPPGVPLNVHAIDCGGDAVERPVGDARPVFLCYGSSITHGGPCAASPSRAWPAVCSRLAGLRLVNLGFGAECFLDQGVARAIRDAPCDCIAIKVGVNVQCMAALTARTFPAAVLGFLQTVRDGHPRTPLVVVSPIWSGPLEERAPVQAPHFLSMAQLRAQLRAAVARLQARGDARLFYRDGLELLGAAEHHLLSDGVHPRERGQLLMGRRFAELEFGAAGRLLPGRCAAAAAEAEEPPAAAALPGGYRSGGGAEVRVAAADRGFMALGAGPEWLPTPLDTRGDLVFPRSKPGLWGRAEGDCITFSDGTTWHRTGGPSSKPEQRSASAQQAAPAAAPAAAEGAAGGEAVPSPGGAAAVRTELRGERQYAVMPDGVGIRYDLLGDAGPCVAFIPGGQKGVCDGQLSLTQFARCSALLQLRGFRVLLHDRRNTGASDVGYAAGATEAEQQAEDLHRLAAHLGLGPLVLVGNSSGGRLSLLLARRRPAAVRALALMNLTGGAVAAERLAHEYYRRYEAAAGSAEGMRAVRRSPHFSALCEANPANQRRLLDMEPGAFAAAMRASAAWLEASVADPVLGHGEAELRGVEHPAKVVFSMHAAKCPMHTLDASRSLHAALPGAVGPLAEWQTMEAITTGILDFINGLELAPDSGSIGNGVK